MPKKLTFEDITAAALIVLEENLTFQRLVAQAERTGDTKTLKRLRDDARREAAKWRKMRETRETL
jgi:hypothetical protein